MLGSTTEIAGQTIERNLLSAIIRPRIEEIWNCSIRMTQARMEHTVEADTFDWWCQPIDWSFRLICQAGKNQLASPILQLFQVWTRIAAALVFLLV